MDSDKLQVFLTYTDRFDRIMAEWPIELRLQRHDDMEADLQQQVVKTLKKNRLLVLRYINLCSEELYLHRNQLVDDEIFAMWKNHMASVFAIPAVKAVWEEISTGYSADFVDFIESLTA